ncbi:MAG: hypothetical protein IMF19_06700 [Proteobacteria bacterium]|nr:hypothetical protein [Pseudomonadota bacterium]
MPCKVTESGFPTTNGVKHEFTDLFGVGGRIFLTTIYQSQRIGLDVLMRQLESVVPGIDYYSVMIIKNEIGEIERFPDYKRR